MALTAASSTSSAPAISSSSSTLSSSTSSSSSSSTSSSSGGLFTSTLRQSLIVSYYGGLVPIKFSSLTITSEYHPKDLTELEEFYRKIIKKIVQAEPSLAPNTQLSITIDKISVTAIINPRLDKSSPSKAVTSRPHSK